MHITEVEGFVDSLGKKKHRKRKNRKAIYMALGSCIVCSILGMSLVLPIFDDKTGWQYLQSLLDDNRNINPVGDEPPPEPEAYNYWYAPENSFGIREMKEVNWSFFDTCFSYEKFFNNVSSDYELEIEYQDVDNNTNMRKYKYKLKTDDEGYYGLNIIFDPKFDDYTFYESNYSFIVHYNGGDIVYNFTDIVNTLDGDINYYINDDVFYLELGKYIEEDIEFEIDPTFGQESGTSYTSIFSDATNKEYIKGVFDAPASSGTVDNITVNFKVVGFSVNIECALYDYVDYSSDYAGALIDTTETVLVTGVGEWVFDFSEPKPPVVDGTNYYICVRPTGDYSSGGNIQSYGLISSGAGIWKGSTSGIAFEDPLTGDGSQATRPYLWASYTEGAPTQSAQKIWNSTLPRERDLNATHVYLAPTSFNVTISDNQGDKMNITILSNESGSWAVVNQTSNGGLSDGTYSYTNTSWVDTYETKYWISFNVTDGTYWTNETFHFTTTNVSIYYFDDYDTGEDWTSNPERMVDGEIGVDHFAFTGVNNQVQNLTSNTCYGVDFGTITSVSLRCHGGYGSGVADVELRPIFSPGGDGDDYPAGLPGPGAGARDWTEWDDITNDGAAPGTWSWSDVENLCCDVQSDLGILETVTIGMVQIRVNFTEPAANTAPTLAGEIPTNGSTGISLTPICNVTANDEDGGDTLTVSFYENTTGSWILQQTNGSVSPGDSVQWDNYSNATTELTKYWWAVNVTDSTDYINETYNFTTAANITNITIKNLCGTLYNLTWIGDAGNTVWSNATSGCGGTLEYNMTINSTNNITLILIYCDDLDSNITADNIQCYLSSDNSSFGPIGSFASGGSNLTIDKDMWVAGTMGTNVFNGTGLTDKIVSIFLRFRLTIPIDANAGIFTQNDWKIRACE